MLHFKFDIDKAVAVTVYISKKLMQNRRNSNKADLHRIFKILYFADQKHLVRYGRPIVGDHYIAMEHGPVPSHTYDILKGVRGDSIFGNLKKYNAFFEVEKHYLYPKRDPDMAQFSESDLECIDESLRANQYLSFNKLKEKSHDSAYSKASKDDKISYREMAKAGGAEYAMLTYLQGLSENDRALSK